MTRELDHAIRILDYGHAADAWEKRMPEETRVWVQAFADGLNAYQDRMTVPPPEFKLLGIKPEPYTFRDILVGSRFVEPTSPGSTIFRCWPAAANPVFATLWNRTLETGEVPTPTSRPDRSRGRVARSVAGTRRVRAATPRSCRRVVQRRR